MQRVVKDWKRSRLDWIAKSLGITKQEDWYKLTAEDAKRNASHTFLGVHFNGSLFTALKTLYPEFEWKPELFPHVPHSYWKNPKNQRNIMDGIAQSLGLVTQQDWYSVTTETIKTYPGAFNFLNLTYGRSLYRALKEIYPEFDWDPLAFQQVPRHYWRHKQHERELFDRIAEKVGIEKQEDWYRITGEEVRGSGGSAVFKKFSDSLYKVLSYIYPEFDWDPQMFVHVPQHHWHKKENQRILFDRIGEQLGVEQQSDWYLVKSNDILELGGAGVLKGFYNNSVHQALQSIYSEFDWLPWKFQSVPKHYFNAIEAQRKCLDWIGEKLNITHPKDWLRISKQQIIDNYGGGLLGRFRNSWTRTLYSVYSEFDWNAAVHTSEGQRHTQLVLQKLLKCPDVLVNHLVPYSDGTFIELDIFMPSLSLAFEYQGAEHYYPNSLPGSMSFPRRRQKDISKAKYCEENGITLIQVPFWWNNSPNSLLAEIRKHRPDINVQMKLPVVL